MRRLCFQFHVYLLMISERSSRIKRGKHILTALPPSLFRCYISSYPRPRRWPQKSSCVLLSIEHAVHMSCAITT